MKLQYTLLGELLSVCVACLTPHLNLSSELRPSGNNIQDMFPIGSTQDRTVIPGSQTGTNIAEESAAPIFKVK